MKHDGNQVMKKGGKQREAIGNTEVLCLTTLTAKMTAPTCCLGGSKQVETVRKAHQCKDKWNS